MLVLMGRILLACGGFRAACFNPISRYCNTISIKQMCKSIVSVYILTIRNFSARFLQRIFRAFNSSISIKFVGGPCSPASRTTVAKNGEFLIQHAVRKPPPCQQYPTHLYLHDTYTKTYLFLQPFLLHHAEPQLKGIDMAISRSC